MSDMFASIDMLVSSGKSILFFTDMELSGGKKQVIGTISFGGIAIPAIMSTYISSQLFPPGTLKNEKSEIVVESFVKATFRRKNCIVILGARAKTPSDVSFSEKDFLLITQLYEKGDNRIQKEVELKTERDGPVPSSVSEVGKNSNKIFVKAKVFSKTRKMSYKNGSYFKMVLEDFESKIDATVFNDACDSLFDTLDENEWYIISNGIVQKSKKQFSTTDHAFELIFTKKTSVSICYD